MPTILIVDDNAVTRKLVCFALKQKGYEVVAAADGNAALEAVAARVPDLVLQDLMLPDMDGFDLALQLRKRLVSPRVPMLAFSGFVSKLEEARIASVGFDDIIAKPVEPSRLVQIIRAHVPDASSALPTDRFGDGRVLLLAEDDPLQAKVMAFRFERLGFTVVTAADGVEALESARKCKPDAIVSDIMMPEADGFRLCIDVRRDLVLKEVPFVLVTSSHVEDADRSLAETVGANACVLRTPDLKEVIGALRAALGPQSAPALSPGLTEAQVEQGHAQRVIQQLERQVRMTAGMAQRCAVLSAELSILSGISGALSRSADLDTSIDEVLSTLLDAGGVSTGALLLFEGPDVRVRSIGTADLWSDAALQSCFGDLDELRSRLSAGAVVSLPEQRGVLQRTERALEEAGLLSALIAPLICRDELVGALLLTSRRVTLAEEDRIAFAVSASAQIAQGIGLARAFAAQASATRRAQDSESTLRSIMQGAAEGIVVAEQSGRLLYQNPAAEAIVRASITDEDPGDCARHYGLFLPDRTTLVPQAQNPLVRAMQGENVRQVELFLRHAAAPNGVWLSVNAQPLLDADGERRGGVTVFRDVTAEKATQEQLMVSDRMASVGTLAAGVAHEINNPLAAVMGNLGLATQGVATLAGQLGASPELARLREELHDASEAADRIRHIVRDLKIFSRSEQEQTAPVDVRAVMESTLRMAHNEIRHRARLVTSYAKVEPVEASESRLGQVFLNLVVNAAQAIPEGCADRNEIRITTSARDDGHIVIAVEDSGMGMSADVLARLFTPFFTTKAVGIGTGLGLSICQRIVSDFGGTIDVRSAVGRGTLVTVTLPPARSVAPEVAPAASVATVTLRRGKVLVIDDEPAIARVVQRTLSAIHDVVTVLSAALALERITAGERYDVILCDLMMPEVTGMDLHAALLRLDRAQAESIIFMTGGAFTPRARAFLDATPNLRIDKPFNAMHLLALVNERVR